MNHATIRLFINRPLAGATKTGKTVLCRKVLGDRDFIWIDGGQIGSADDLWKRVFSELAMPAETSVTTGTDSSLSLGFNKIVTAGGSRLRKSSTTELRRAESMSDAIKFMLEDSIALVVDDFHYMDPQTRTTFMRNIKGSVYNGMKVILLSATHRAFDAISAEPELTGRFIAITLPNWTRDDLLKIPALGFVALRADCDPNIIKDLATEAQESRIHPVRAACV